MILQIWVYSQTILFYNNFHCCRYQEKNFLLHLLHLHLIFLKQINFTIIDIHPIFLKIFNISAIINITINAAFNDLRKFATSTIINIINIEYLYQVIIIIIIANYIIIIKSTIKIKKVIMMICIIVIKNLFFKQLFFMKSLNLRKIKTKMMNLALIIINGRIIFFYAMNLKIFFFIFP